jgi:hypothetical protein
MTLRSKSLLLDVGSSWLLIFDLSQNLLRNKEMSFLFIICVLKIYITPELSMDVAIGKLYNLLMFWTTNILVGT